MADPESFASLLRQARTVAGLSQAGLAERASLSVRAIGELERGNRRHPHRSTVDALARALGLSGSSRALLEAAARAARDDRPLATRPARSLLQTGSSVPAPLSALVGRQREVAEIVAHLHRPTVRLLTLTGPGGVGKTRLALEAARLLADDLSDGVAFVPLADVRGPEQVLPAIADTLGLPHDGQLSAEERLTLTLHRRRLLLLLDTFEHVASAATGIAALLERCPGLQILVTSQLPLHLRGEQLYPVAPLETAHPVRLAGTEPPALADVARVPAVALFVERTRERVPDFHLTAENAAVVAAICTRLDGLPLAIELAAARTAILTPESLLERLDRRLPLLVGGPIDLPARQRTLHDTIVWSQGLLTPDEQRLFRALAVFRGSFTLDLAERVVRGELRVTSDETATSLATRHSPLVTRHSPLATLDGISSLVDKSLLVRRIDAHGTPRFRMLGTVRDLAVGELAATGGLAPLQDRLLDAMTDLGEAAELTGPREAAWLAHLDAEHDNIRAALAWSVEGATPERGVRLLCALLPWLRRATADESFAWAERILSLIDPAEMSEARAQAAFLVAVFAWGLGNGERCRASLDQSVTIWRAHGQQRKLAYALAWQALTGQDADAAAARQAGEEAVTLFRQIDDRWGLAEALHCLGLVLVNLGDLKTAEGLVRESLAICRALGHPRLLGSGLRRLGLLALAQGDPVGARDWLRESLRFYRAADEVWLTARALASLAQVSQCLGEVARTATELAETLRLGRQTGDRWAITAALEGLAWVASRRGRPDRAAELFGAAAGIGDPAWFLVAPMHRELRQGEIDAVRADLGEAVFEAAWSRGQAYLLVQAVDEALAECSQQAQERRPEAVTT